MLLPLFEWCEKNAVTAAIMQSWWMTSVLEVFHLIGLTMLVGAVVVVSLRLMGLAMTRRPVSEVAGELWSWTVLGLVLQLSSGLALFTAESVRWYHSGPFWVKMTLLFMAIAFHFTVYRRVTRRDDVTPLMCRLTGAFALALWLGVGVGGRALTTL